MVPALLTCFERMRRTRVIACLTILPVVWIATAGSTSFVVGQDSIPDSQVQWHTGRKLNQFNKLPISVWWQAAEFKERLVRFSQTQQIAVFIDRRLDPSTIVDLTMKNVTKEQFFWAVAVNTGTGVSRIEDVYYFGPSSSAAQIGFVCQQHRERTSKHQKQFKVDWRKREPLRFQGAVEPKSLLQDLASSNGFRFENLDSIPHDLWAEFELPKTTLQTRLALLLAGFGKSFERNEDGTVVSIVDFPALSTIELTIRDLENASKFAQQMRPQFPDTTISVRGKRLKVSGPPTQVATIESHAVAAQVTENVEGGQKVYTFTRRAARGSILATAAQGKGAVLAYDKSNSKLTKLLNEVVEIRVVNADASGLVNMALEGTDLTFEFSGNKLSIRER